jgi:hypothetical protein
MTTPLDTTKYISFTTYRQDGSAAATPVWVVPFEGGYAFTTDDTSFKVRRLRANPKVQIAPSTFRGVVAPDAQVVSGTAEIVAGEQFDKIEQLIKKKYILAWYLMIVPSQLWARLTKGGAPASVAIKVTPTS